MGAGLGVGTSVGTGSSVGIGVGVGVRVGVGCGVGEAVGSGEGVLGSGVSVYSTGGCVGVAELDWPDVSSLNAFAVLSLTSLSSTTAGTDFNEGRSSSVI